MPNLPTPTAPLPTGLRVTYRGSLDECHGDYVVIGRCLCRDECLDNSFAPERYELGYGDVAVLAHVRRESIYYRAR